MSETLTPLEDGKLLGQVKLKDNSDFQVVDVHADLILYVDNLQRKNAEALSFYPKCVFEREAENRRILLGLLNGQPCGYIYMGAIRSDVKCHQVCIEYDARRRLYGARLVDAMEKKARGAYSITLRCGFDLEANTFWAQMGYVCVAVHEGGLRRMRKINVWRKDLQAQLFELEGVVPSSGKTDASFWRKNKKIGVVNQFARGKRLQDYRAACGVIPTLANRLAFTVREPKPAGRLPSEKKGD